MKVYFILTLLSIMNAIFTLQLWSTEIILSIQCKIPLNVGFEANHLGIKEHF